MPLSSVPKHVSDFQRVRPIYKRFAGHIHYLINAHFPRGLVHTTEFRAKNLESFERKCRKLNEDGTVRYKDPLKDITDLAGVRVIVFTRAAVDSVCAGISNILNVTEMQDIGERVYNQGKFGYQSKHLLVVLGSDRKGLFENHEFADLVCEVQVRTILQHAWAEIEHDIQYKSDEEIPLDLRKRFSALAGLLELGDREFQRIQDDSESLKSAVKADLVNDLTQQGLSARQNSDDVNSAQSAEQSVAVRDLINKGRYEEAVDLYSKKIEIHPQAHTLYIGRAKARFLLGDAKGSLSDLDRAEELSGDVEHTRQLRALIEHGDDPRSALRAQRSESRHSEGLRRASEAIRSGEGVRAFDEYTALDADGYNKAFSLFSRAVCCALEKDYRGSRSFLDGLQIRPATPMAINILALRGALEIMEHPKKKIEVSELLSALHDFPNYSFEISPLRDFLEGLQAKGYPEAERIAKLFEIISTPSSTRE